MQTAQTTKYQATQYQAPPIPERRPRAWKKTKRPPATRRADAKPATKRSAPPAALPTRAAKPTPRPQQPALAKKTPPPVVDEWSKVETNIARARCQHLLKQIDAVTVPQTAMKKGPCGDAAPVKLISIGSSPQVSISPPAVVNCQMVHALHNWLEKDLQPLAKKHLGAKIVTIENMSSYSCRNAYGRTSTRLSEHGRANALDIRGFVTANAKHTRLLKDWGPTKRSILQAQKAQAAKEMAAKEMAAKEKAVADAKALARLNAKKKATEQARAAKATTAKRDTATMPTDNAGIPLPVRGTIMETSSTKRSLGLAPSRLGGPDQSVLRVSNTRQAKFLRAAHVTACRRFGTVLGPEANNAHNNHFHVDLAERKRSNYCR